MIDRIKQSLLDDRSDNPWLNFSAYVLEARKAGIDVSSLAQFWIEELVTPRRARPGIFKRWPKRDGKWTTRSTSNDELYGGIIPMSYLFNQSREVWEIYKHGLTLGLWLTGRWTKKWWHPDTEWFVYWRPDFRGYFKLALGKPLSWLETWGMKLNIMVSDDTNMIRVKLLYLEMIGFEPRWVAKQMRRIDWGHLKGYHHERPMMHELWRLQDERAANNN
jgi:hypothetical protein